MKNFNEIVKKVNQEINEESITVYFQAELNEVAPFMCNAYDEGWLWSNETKNIVNYVFEIIITNFLVDSLMAFEDYDQIDMDNYDFLKAVDFYKECISMSKQKTIAYNKLVKLYNVNIDRNISYLELVKLFVELEKCCLKLGVYLEFESYSSPLEARHSEKLSIHKFDFKNLKNNF